ncbi:MAG: hypothetical protein K6L75_11935 [Cellvibrionaceae bacterium]
MIRLFLVLTILLLLLYFAFKLKQYLLGEKTETKNIENKSDNEDHSE